MIVATRDLMAFSDSICGICEQTSTIYGITHARNRSDGGGFAWIDSGWRAAPPRHTHNVILSTLQFAKYAPRWPLFSI